MLCYVLPEVRFRRVGSAMLSAIEANAFAAGIRALRLESTRTAQTFYLRSGLVSAGPPSFSFGMEAYPMSKRLVAEFIASSGEEEKSTIESRNST